MQWPPDGLDRAYAASADLTGDKEHAIAGAFRIEVVRGGKGAKLVHEVSRGLRTTLTDARNETIRERERDRGRRRG